MYKQAFEVALSRPPSETAELDDVFMSMYEDAMRQARALVLDRAVEYNGTVALADYFPSKMDYATILWQKHLRLQNQIRNANGDKSKIEDTILDHINYLAFLHAYLQLGFEQGHH